MTRKNQGTLITPNPQLRRHRLPQNQEDVPAPVIIKEATVPIITKEEMNAKSSSTSLQKER